ncbi:Methylmalonyl-CoA decarboxylase [Escherichia coli]|nr:Methylmalonyl-CoA decarboxylase [Escherichia coli]
MSYQYVNVVTINKVAVIEFNYGRKLNALSKVFIDDLMQALSDLNRPEIRCIILRAHRVDPKSSPQVTIFTNCRLAVAIRSPMMIHCVKSPA